MINVDDNFKIDIRTYGRQFDVKLKANNEDLTGDDLNYIKPSFNTSLFKTIMHQIKIDSNVYIPIKTKITGKIGVKVNEKTYNYIDLNTYYVKSCERQEDTNSYRILAYTKMQEAMIDNELTLTDRLTVRNYLIAVCQKLNWNTDNIPETFINSDKLVDPTLHMEIGYTYRDILDEIATITCSFLLFKGENLYLIYPTETNQNIDESYLDEDNITIGEKYIINSLVFSRAEESDNIYRKDDENIATNGLHEYRISDCQLLSTNDRSDYIDAMFNYLKTLEFYIFDVKSKGILFLEACDIFNFILNEVTYKTILLNNEIELEDGLTEKLYTDEPEETETEYKYADSTDKKINKTYFLVDKQNKKIEQLVNETSEHEEKITQVEQDVNGLKRKVSQVADLTREIEGIKTITLENCAEGELLELHVYGNNTVFKYQVLRDDLYLSNDLILGKDKSILIITDENNNSTEYDLLIPGVLRQNGTTCDEYILQNGTAKIIRRINEDGTIKDSEEVETLGTLSINLFKGTNKLTIKDFTAKINAKWAIQSDLTDTFATHVEVNTKIEENSTTIMSEVNKKVDEKEFGTKVEQNYEHVKIAWNKIAEYIQMMLIKNNASFAILDDNKKVLMYLDKAGQHFCESDGSTVFGEMGVNKEESNNYISFSVEGDYNQDINNGMAWGIKTSDEKFHPILYLKDFHMGAENADDFFGKLVLNYCDLVLAGMESGIQSGNIRMYGNAFNGITFDDINTGKTIMSILPEGTYSYGAFNLLDTISFYRNMAGSNSLKIGNDNKYVLIQDDGSFHVMGGVILLGNSSNKVDFSLYVQSTANIWGNLNVEGNVYADNISSDRRIKKNIKDSKTSALEIIKKIQHKEFDKKDDGKHYKIGYIAQELEEIDSNFVIKRPENKDKNIEERYYINELPIIATLTKAIQEQQEIIEQMQKRINEMEDRINGKN